ncbi:hypothetical protein BDW59DRAFT_169019 [Aspergillus cavernicola]|uniref:Azaphilone pigments biosynthesis cluster protein L N-terminal domain-containing protein n=1 Tax=Aspergillus cavernicola TaxID=176166 RepID=A0ABR4J2M1_9EURO
MAEPLGIAASVLAIITTAIQSTKSLHDTVRHFKVRNKTLQRLKDELEDLTEILDLLTHAVNTEASVLVLLQGPIDRCSQVCREFEQSMKVFSRNSKTGFRDWRKMEFMGGDINEFIDIISGYRSTISVGLGTITMLTSKVSYQVLQEYNEMTKDTSYNLEVSLQRIDERLAQLIIEDPDTSSAGDIDLKDEGAVTKQCLCICEDMKLHIDSLATRESSILQNSPQTDTEEAAQKPFEAQQLTRQALGENQNSFAEIIGSLRERLKFLVGNEDPRYDNERLRLQEDISISKQCLEVCKVASDISDQKIFRVGEVITDGDSDQVVVTTLADLFDVRKVMSPGNSAQLVGSMAPENLRHLVDNRYSSFIFKSTRASSPRTGYYEQNSGLSKRGQAPSPKQMRKLVMGGAMD